MSEFYVVSGLYTWRLTLENGAQRAILASSLASAITGILPSPIISADRLGAFDPEQDTTPPVLTSLMPSSAQLGDPDFTLHVHGTGFRPGALILWNGVPEPTTVISDTEVVTTVNMATAEVAMAIPVAVQIPMGLVSNELTFDLQPAA